MRHKSDEGGQEEHGDKADCGGDQLCHLAASAGQAVHCSLASAATGGHGTQQGTTRIRKACGQQLSVRVGRRFFTLYEGPSRSNGFSKAHERDAQGSRPELRCKVEIWYRN